MNVTLVLTRHGKSAWDDPALPDHDRTLTRRGRESATKIGRWLGETGVLPLEALVSTAARAVETWSRLSAELPDHPEPRIEKALYHARPEALLTRIRALSEPVAIVIGHNPGIGSLAGALAARSPGHARFADYPTCATTVFRFAVPWSEVAPGGGEVAAFVIPREL